MSVNVVLCAACAEIDPRFVVYRSTRVPCGECGQDVWLSPASAAWAAKHLAMPICFSCLRPTTDMQFAPPTPEQIEEVRKCSG